MISFFHRSKSSGLLLMAGSSMRDPERRNVFAWTGNSPVSRPLDDHLWYITKEADVYIIKSARYGEYLYAAADDLAFDDKNRSVFTWKTRDNLGLEGHWIIRCPGMTILNSLEPF